MTAPNPEQTIAEHGFVFGPGKSSGTVMVYCTSDDCDWKPRPVQNIASGRRSHAAHVVAAIRDSGYTVIALPEAEAEYPETLAVARLIYENLPSEDPGGGVEPWDALTAERRAPFLMNARNLGHVFPDEYPKLAAELARYRAAQHAGDTQ